MPDEVVSVPLCNPILKVRVVALFKGKEAGPFKYLQGTRSGILKLVNSEPEKTEVARAYHRSSQEFFAKLANAVPGPVDAILSPPSDMAWQSEPYRRAIATRFPAAVDLSGAISRGGTARAGKGASLEEILGGLSYRPCGREKDFRRIVIVDDTFTTGTTAAALVSLLHEHGVSKTCEVILACPLWLDMVNLGASES